MRRLVDLLEKGRQDGYPTDYLLARLRSRMSGFTDRCPAGRSEEAWQELQKEFRWVFRQMNVGLRHELAPVFFYFELRNLFVALRFISGADRSGLNTALAASMLGPQLQAVLRKEQSFPAKLKELGGFLGRYGEGFGRLEEVWWLGGMLKLETSLLSGFVRIIAREKLPPAVADFLGRLLDRRHLLLLAKEQRWRLSESLPLADQPALVRRRLKRYLEQLGRKNPGVTEDPARLDNLLLRTMLRDSRRLARTSQALETILAYLCSCWLTARDCGVRGLSPLLGEARVETELVI